MSLPVIEMKAKPVQAPEPVIFAKEEEDHEELEESEEDLDDCVHIGSGGGDDPPVEEKEVFLPKEEEEVAEAIEKETGKEIKKGKRAYNRKKPMSQKQLDHLAKIRAIGVEKRKERAKEAREKKILDQENQAEERLLKRKEKEEDDKILKDAKEAQKVRQEKLKQNRPATAQVPLAYSQEDLENAMVRAVETYDNQRKVRKEAKKKKIAQEKSDKNKVNMIQNAINPNLNQAPTHDPWRQFFT
jgi:hypothetical protein